MTTTPVIAVFPRRDLLKAGGALLIGFSIASGARAQEPAGIAIVLGPDQPDQKRLDTWIAIHQDNTATIYFGHVELGQGASTALLQIAAEELDLGIDQVRAATVDTRRSPNQGATVASAAVALGGQPVRRAAAEARQALLALASRELGVPAGRLEVERGIVSVAGDATRSVSFGELLGDEPFELPFTGTAPVKSARDYKIVGTRVPRGDIPAKARGDYEHMQHVRIHGMLHGRIVRPRGQPSYGDPARAVALDESSIDDIDDVRIVRIGNFLGVVAPRQWDAVRAAERLDVSWETPAALPGTAGLHARMRAEQTFDRVVLETGAVDTALADARHVVAGRYEGPYQAHAPFAPNCAIADVRSDSAIVYCSTQNIYEVREKVAHVLGKPVEEVDIVYCEGSGTFGRSCFDDAAEAAALMSEAVGAPVRVQYMRWDEHGWDNYGPAHLAEVRAGIDAEGKLTAYEYHGWQHEWSVVETSEQLAMGTPAAERPGPIAQEISAINLGSMYAIDHRLIVNHRIDGTVGYLKGANLRSPLDMSMSFASEQTIDELSHLAGEDPYAFRRANMTDERWLGVLDAVAEASGWQPRRAASNAGGASIETGRGIALGTHLTSYAAAVAEIEVNRASGEILVKHLYGALDAGLAVNPGFLENQITGMLVQAASRMLKEEITFSPTAVTSLDWASYPILRFAECPDVTPIVIQHRDVPPSGGGEELIGPAGAAIANAFFDATGVRLRSYPLTSTRVRAALNAA